MTVFRTCKNCVREKEPCERRDDLRTSLAGLGVTSVKLRCKERRPLYGTGQRVLTTWTVGDPESYYQDATEEAWPATVIKESGSQFLLKVDEADSDHGTPAKGYFKSASLYIKARVGRIAPLDEPTCVVCPTCARVGAGGAGEGGCYGYEGQRPEHLPFGCLAKPEAA